MAEHDATLEATTTVPGDGRRGRGAGSNGSSRYDAERRLRIDDGWDPDEVPALRTTVTCDSSRSIMTRNVSPDIPFDRSINPYRGCEHGCIYCFARPTHAYLGLSPGLDFESRLFVKPDAAALLKGELERPGYRCQPIAIGTNTDPYQPIEREYRVMRAILEVLSACDHPVSIVTKSALVVRDLDLLETMAARRLVKVALSVTTLDRTLARRMEPRAATPERRLQAIAALSAAGVPTAVMAAPMIPGLNDAEMETILERAAAAGAAEAGFIPLRLPREVRELFHDWLKDNYPDRAARVVKLIRGIRGGRDNDPRFGSRMRGSGPYAAMLEQRFRLTAARLGLNRRRLSLDTSRFRPPPRPGEQMRLL